MFWEGSARWEVFQRIPGYPEGVPGVFRGCSGRVPGLFLFLKKPMQSNQFGREQPVPGSEIVGSAELRKRKQENKT